MKNIVYMIELLRETSPKYYIGSKSSCKIIEGKIFDKRNKEYLGSAKDKSLKTLITDGTPYRIHILGTYDTYHDALTAERTVQITNDVVASPDFFNKSIATINNFTDPQYGTYKHSVSGKVARLERTHPRVLSGEWVGVSTGYKHTPEALEKLKLVGEKNGFFGKSHTDKFKEEQSKRKILEWKLKSEEEIQIFAAATSKRFKGVPKTEEHRSKIGRNDMIMLKNINTEETVRIHKSEAKNYSEEIWVNPIKFQSLRNELPKEICPHCNKVAIPSNIKRWHGDKCKFKATGIYVDSTKDRKTDRKNIQCTINGVEYKTLREAERKTGISRLKLKKMIINGEL